MGNQLQKGSLVYPTDHEQQQKEDEEAFTCEICIEPITPPNTRFRINTDHKTRLDDHHRFCTDCMIKYIQMKLENNVSEIKCPSTACDDHSLDPLSCRPQIPQPLFVRWCDALCESTVLNNTDHTFVYCPNRGCSELILNECAAGNLKRCVCPKCKNPFCFTCKVPWHGASTNCVDENNNDVDDENEVAFRRLYTLNKWRICPKCGQCIEDVDNCRGTIHCRCGFKFCYNCGDDLCIQERRKFLKEGLIVGVLLYGPLFILYLVLSLAGFLD